jgi:hypothetical protein
MRKRAEKKKEDLSRLKLAVVFTFSGVSSVLFFLFDNRHIFCLNFLIACSVSSITWFASFMSLTMFRYPGFLFVVFQVPLVAVFGVKWYRQRKAKQVLYRVLDDKDFEQVRKKKSNTGNNRGKK